MSHAHALGTKIHLHSEDGAGSCFYFDLTLALVEPQQSAEDRVQEAYGQQALSLLLVEDNSIALRVLETMVKQAGWSFVSAIDAETALELAKSQPFDLIISDLGLPGMSGIDLAKQVRAMEASQTKPPVPIVGLTAHAQDQVRNDCLASGMTEVFNKPMEFENLQQIGARYCSATSTGKPQTPKAGPEHEGLPSSEAEWLDLDEHSLFDPVLALTLMNQDKTLLRSVLDDFVGYLLDEDLQALQLAHAAGDWLEVERVAHKMKGGVEYCGTVRLKYACQSLERYHKAGRTAQWEPLYQQLLRVAEETRVVLRTWLLEEPCS